MIQKLKPVIAFESDSWSSVLERYQLKSVMSAAHMQMIWYQMQKVTDPTIWYEMTSTETVLAVATLGKGVDVLLAEWSESGRVLDSYAADCLSMEALQCMYRLLEDELLKKGVFIAKYIFPEPATESGNEMAAILEQLQCRPAIQLTEDGMLRPMKSVVFRAVLTKDQEKRCSTVCAHCHRTDCPNRHSLHMGNYREPGALKYSYGYQRIFGRS